MPWNLKGDEAFDPTFFMKKRMQIVNEQPSRLRPTSREMGWNFKLRTTGVQFYLNNLLPVRLWMLPVERMTTTDEFDASMTLFKKNDRGRGDEWRSSLSRLHLQGQEVQRGMRSLRGRSPSREPLVTTRRRWTSSGS